MLCEETFTQTYQDLDGRSRRSSNELNTPMMGIAAAMDLLLLLRHRNTGAVRV